MKNWGNLGFGTAVATPRSQAGYRVHRSRRRKGRDNAGQFMLVHKGKDDLSRG